MAKHIVQCTATGEQHGMINVLSNSVPFDDFKNMKPETKAQCEKLKKEESRMVKVTYQNTRGKHERLTKPYCRWAGDPIQQWHLIPGHTYEVPMGFVKEINEEQGEIARRSGLVSVDGKDLNDGAPLDKDEKGERIHRLYPAEFK
jgi:hypothetical protein